METTLFLGDFKMLDTSRLEALATRTNNQDVFIARGKVRQFAFNDLLTESDENVIKNYFNFTFIDYEEVKKRFMKFTHKYVVDSNDLLIQAFIEDLNLTGRTDIEFLKFEISEEQDLLQKLKKSEVILLNRVKSLSEQISDMKILISAILSTMPEDQRKKVDEIYTQSKKSVEETLRVSQTFISLTSQFEGKVSIEEAVQKFETENKFEGFSEIVFQTLEKVKSFDSKDKFEEFVTSPRAVSDILNDQAIINSIIIAYTQYKR